MGLLSLPNVKDEPRPWLARAVLLGARIVTAMVVGSGALFGDPVWNEDEASSACFSFSECLHTMEARIFGVRRPLEEIRLTGALPIAGNQ
jgi:hypothetical protein